ncbi:MULTISPECIES: PadR family transcriptional regulator [Carnobacterium]|uniref:PadR family transcriptional regulator n=1 Tax=Carnobacterium divergens TaxID=2748 RepID=A0A2R8A2V5_CARDV|nr:MULTISPECIES: PadR family transcriptional regulator [Carnobacterium]MCO6016926.1 PadR family transcriptional regulator [Carnobacterium divergens]MDT1940637.1 PadR family transcriptional regulator [Carnobacterium divergens]MDT1943075.1 PadR family transcriptional regulator [Carnobacterium divergens]MDT1948882.1 PadR family transcriptional regulator [Carnobacterium divergens]MDT1951362.1 PadR family transcriptional regulator [Carnobacterium divergens]
MDNIVLGLLLMEPLTAYEIRKFIGDNLQSICSDSRGSIQSAINKLLKNNLIYLEEKVENGVNKKRYFINENGKIEFTKWIGKPMVAGKIKNMELSRLFFMGTVPQEKQIELIDGYLSSLKKEKKYLEDILDSIFDSKLTEHLSVQQELDSEEKKYQFFTLKYGLEHNLFDIQFFEKLKEQIIADKKANIKNGED